MPNPILLLVIQYGAWVAALVHGMLTRRSGSLAAVGLIWGLISAAALLLADGQGAFLGFVLFPLICWALASAGRTCRQALVRTRR